MQGKNTLKTRSAIPLALNTPQIRERGRQGSRCEERLYVDESAAA